MLRGIGSFEGVTGKGTWSPAGPGWEPDSKGINIIDGALEMP